MARPVAPLRNGVPLQRHPFPSLLFLPNASGSFEPLYTPDFPGLAAASFSAYPNALMEYSSPLLLSPDGAAHFSLRELINAGHLASSTFFVAVGILPESQDPS